MIRINTIEVAGFVSALKALRLPFKKECRSEVSASCSCDTEEIRTQSWAFIDPKDMLLMSTLVKRGTEHAKVTRGLIAYAEIEAPVYWWCELETYRAGHERLSSESTMHVDCRGLSGEELVKAKSEIPMGKMLKKVDSFSYQCLRNIVKQRKGHRLPEWAEFLEWVSSLPYTNELILIGLEDEGR